jgi:hypothetical protein
MRRLVLIATVVVLLTLYAAPAWAVEGDPGTGTTGFDYAAWAVKWQHQAQVNVAAYNRVAHRLGHATFRCPRFYATDAVSAGKAYKAVAVHFQDKLAALRHRHRL